MQKGILLVTSVLLALGAGEAQAKEMPWEGTLELELGGLGDGDFIFTGGGVATVNGPGVGNILHSLRLAGGITGSATIPISDPDIAGTLSSIRVLGILGTGTMSGWEPIPSVGLVPANNSIPIQGGVRLCTFVPGCSNSLTLPFSKHNGASGVGIGGLLTVGGPGGGLNFSIQANPWTLSASLGVDTSQGGTTLLHRTGFLHNPNSFANSLAQEGAVIQLITPIEIRGEPLPGSQASDAFYAPGFTTFTLRFVPEPGGIMLLLAGVIGLGTLGRGPYKN